MTVIRTADGLIVVDNFMHRTSTALALAVAARDRAVVQAKSTPRSISMSRRY